MDFTNTEPNSWLDLQNKVTLYLNEAGHKAVSPLTINTVRGSVEVDVYIEAPDELVKRIICECKYWKTPVSKEKVHAFRTVVADSGAALGIMISKEGFQKGAIDAAKLSNVILLTWEQFTTLISRKWMREQTKTLRKVQRAIYVYTSEMTVPYELISEEGKREYHKRSKPAGELWEAACDLRSYEWQPDKIECISDRMLQGFTALDEYIRYLIHEMTAYNRWFAAFFKKEGINFPDYKFEPIEQIFYRGL